MTNRFTSRRGRLLAGAAVFTAMASLAHAQTTATATAAVAATAASSAAPSGARVEEVTVTARHRSESLQEVPLSVAVVNGTAAAAQNLNDIADISSEIPSVDFRTGASNKDRTVFIRGIGTISTSPGVEPSVSTVIDGVVMARSGMATPDLLDLDHIEVLQGPQGTLFGKNASAGVVNIVTQNPTDAFHAYVEGAAYQGDEFRLKAGVSGPIIPGKLDGLLSVFTAQYKGNVLNLADDKEENGYRHTGVRAKFIATPSDTLKLTLGADYTDSSDTTPTGVFISASQIAYPTGVVSTSAPLAAVLSSQGITPFADNRTVDNNWDTSVHDKNGGVSLQADWTVFGEYKVTSITAYRQWKNVQYQNYSQLAGPTANFAQGNDTGHVDFDQTSQELRIASPKGQFIDYVAGLYWLRAVDNETYERDITQLNSTGGPIPNTGLGAFGTVENNFALFGEADINLTRKFRAIAGYREIFDWLSYYDNRSSTSAKAIPGVGVSIVNGPGSTQDTGYADRFGLQYDFSNQLTGYATYSRGYKGPAYDVFFNMALVNTPPLAPETSNSYEVGLKTNLFDQRVRADLSGFITNYQNYQANFNQEIAGAIVTNLINAGAVSTKGFEGDLTARPVEPLTLGFNFLYDDATVVNFPCPPGAALSCDINGQPLPFAPRWKLHLESQYKIASTPLFDVALESDYNWQTKVQYQLSETPNTIQPAYGIWNASIALLGKENSWQARFLIKNILDQHYSPYLSNGTFAGTVRWVPRDDDRYVGIDLRKNF